MYGLVKNGYVSDPDINTFYALKFKYVPVGDEEKPNNYYIGLAGPDHEFDTADDIEPPIDTNKHSLKNLKAAENKVMFEEKAIRKALYAAYSMAFYESTDSAKLSFVYKTNTEKNVSVVKNGAFYEVLIKIADYSNSWGWVGFPDKMDRYWGHQDYHAKEMYQQMKDLKISKYTIEYYETKYTPPKYDDYGKLLNKSETKARIMGSFVVEKTNLDKIVNWDTCNYETVLPSLIKTERFPDSEWFVTE